MAIKQVPGIVFYGLAVMTASYFTIGFQHNGLHYTGRVSPEKKDAHGRAVSWHVVLNETFFGYLSRNAKQWVCSEWRPQELVDIVGNSITNEENPAG